MNKILKVLAAIGLLTFVGWLLAGWAVAATIYILCQSSVLTSLIMLWWVASWVVFVFVAFLFDCREKKKNG